LSFGTPLWLLALLAIPALIALYVATGRNRRRAAATFSSPQLAPSVMPVSPGWRRHVPIALLFAAIAALLFTLARPQRAVSVPVEQAQIMLVTDVSGSMLSTDVKPNRLTAAKQAARLFLDSVPENVNVGIMTFNQTPRVLQSPTTDRSALRGAIDQYRPGGGTATGDALVTALNTLGKLVNNPAAPANKRPSAIVLLSDGFSNKGSDPIEAARIAGRLKTPISTITLGTQDGTITVPRPHGQPGMEVRKVPPDTESLDKIASLSGGRAFAAPTADALKDAYKRLGSQLGRKKEHHDLTAGFAGIAALLAIAGAALSLHWFGRLA